MKLNKNSLPGMIDISALHAKTTEQEVVKLAKIASDKDFIAAFVLPSHIPKLMESLANSQVIVGAPVGFPTGGDLTIDKEFQVKEMRTMGCSEFDMVINIGKLKSGRYDYVEDEIKRVIEAASGYPVKVILEVTYLTDDEIRRASQIVVKAGADYIKTGTGYAPSPTEIRHIKLIREAVGPTPKIKVAGGVRSFSLLKDFYEQGAERFGIGVKSAVRIIEEAPVK